LMIFTLEGLPALSIPASTVTVQGILPHRVEDFKKAEADVKTKYRSSPTDRQQLESPTLQWFRHQDELISGD
jgi:hypothetical protein